MDTTAYATTLVVVPKKHQCKICSHTFSRNEHLVRHMVTIHNEEDPRQYVCQLCGAAFNRSDLLKRHDDNVHIARENRTGDPLKSLRSVRARMSSSCQACARAKCKCDPGRPCQPCQLRGSDCIPQVSKRGTRTGINGISVHPAQDAYVTRRFSYGVKLDWKAGPGIGDPAPVELTQAQRENLLRLAPIAPAAKPPPKMPGSDVYQPFDASVTYTSSDGPVSKAKVNKEFEPHHRYQPPEPPPIFAPPMAHVLQQMSTAQALAAQATSVAPGSPVPPPSLKRKASDTDQQIRPISEVLASIAPSKPSPPLAKVAKVEKPAAPTQGKSLWEVLLDTNGNGR